METENMDVDFCKKYTAKLQEKVVLSANGQCQLWTGCRKGKFSDYGVINCRFECGYRTVTVHRLSYMLEHKMTRVEPGSDASHLCHNSLCLTASHISMEPHSINNNRQYRVSQNVCFGHAPYQSACCNSRYFNAIVKLTFFEMC